jgi:small-conductance mechanosensitive channel
MLERAGRAAPPDPRPLAARVARARLAAAVAAALALVPVSSPAQEQTAVRPPQKAEAGEARVVFLNREIATFRSSFLGYTPEERVVRAKERIRELLSRPGKLEVGVKPTSEGQIVTIDGAMVFVVAPEDVDPLREDTVEAAVRRSTRALEQVIAETRETRNVRALLKGVLLSLAATAAFVLLVWLARRLRRATVARLTRLLDTRAQRLQVGGAELVSHDRLVSAIRWIVNALFWTVVLLLAYEWVGFVLGRFPYTRPWGEHLNGLLLGAAIRVGSVVVAALPGLFFAAFILFAARFIVGLLRKLFDRVEGGGLSLRWLDADTVRPTRRIVNVVVWIFAVAMAYPYLPGAESEAFKGLSVLVGLMISLGASSVVGQAASGLIMMYTRTLRSGEYVRIGDHEGTVVDAGLFVTRIRTGLGEELTLSNSLVAGAVTKNYSRAVAGPGFVLDTSVTIGYDTPWRQVEAMLLEAARRTEGVLPEPPARVFQTALSDFYVEYRLVCYASPVKPLPRALVLSSLHAHVLDVFNEHGVQIMSPHYLGDPERPKVVTKADWHPAPVRPPGGGGGSGGSTEGTR